MLTHLSIVNYALIDSLEIDFKQGLTIITGETGAGKSIILGALSLILGERADLKVIRHTEAKSIIEATFDIRKYEGINCYLFQNDIESFGTECILRREISANGRSRAFINDCPVTLSIMRDVTLNLIDIHSQHSNLMLGNEDYQMQIIDSVSANEQLRKDYQEIYNKYKSIKDKLAKLKNEYERNKQDEDYIRFQLTQIADLKLQENEDEELEQEQIRLSNVDAVKQCLWSVTSGIQDDDNSVLSILSGVSRDISKIENVEVGIKDVSDRLHSTIIELKDIVGTVNSLQDTYVDNPIELERINERLNIIYSLENKHKVSSVNELIELQHQYESKLSLIDNSDEEIKRLEKELIENEVLALNVAHNLTETRKIGVKEFKQNLESMALSLGLKNLRFDVAFETTKLNHSGVDKIKFLFAFNKQQQLMTIENTASGGELSRVMLCIKAIVAQNMQLPTIIFDEVDTGVSGEIAHKMGEVMTIMSQNIQVIAITHLPQIAVRGNYHFKVYKEDNDECTYTSMKELNKEERVNEIARMLSGKKIDDAAIYNAKSLLNL